jgi:hypothetical protein
MANLDLNIEKDRDYEIKLGESFLGEAGDRVAYHGLYCTRHQNFTQKSASNFAKKQIFTSPASRPIDSWTVLLSFRDSFIYFLALWYTMNLINASSL